LPRRGIVADGSFDELKRFCRHPLNLSFPTLLSAPDFLRLIRRNIFNSLNILHRMVDRVGI
jgi:hypothetical protein